MATAVRALYETVSTVTANFRHSLHTIDATPRGDVCGTSVYLLVSSRLGGQPTASADHFAAFVDSSNSHAYRRIEDVVLNLKLPWESVKYIFLTHAHLDHAAGASNMMKFFPNAKIVCDPRCLPHVVDPSNLISSARRVYGEAGALEQVGEMEPIDPRLVESVGDGALIDLCGERPLRFMHVEGHAKHHIAIYDEVTGSCITGDAFGTRYPVTQELLGIPNIFFPTTTPIDFDYTEHVKSIERISQLPGLQRFCPTHFGMSSEVAEARRQMLSALPVMESIRQRAFEKMMSTKIQLDSEGIAVDSKEGIARMDKSFDECLLAAVAEVKSLLENHMLALLPSTADAARREDVKRRIPWDSLRMETEVNALGLVVAAQRAVKQAAKKRSMSSL